MINNKGWTCGEFSEPNSKKETFPSVFPSLIRE